MSTYTLTRAETWMLCTAMYLPVQPGSLLATFLGGGDLATAPDVDATWEGLRAKGMYDPANAENPIADDLIVTMMHASTSPAEITAVIRRGSRGGMTRFGPAGDTFVQCAIDGDEMTLESARPASDVAAILMPPQMIATTNEGMRADLDVGAFLYLKQACWEADRAFVEGGFESEVIDPRVLEERFKAGNRYVDLFHGIGMRGVPPIDEMPVSEYFDQLLARGFLVAEGDGVRIGEGAEPLRQTFADPDMWTLILSMRVWDGGWPRTGMFLAGHGRLFLMEVTPGVMLIRQMDGADAAREWAASMLSTAAAARSTELLVPGPPVVGEEEAPVAQAPAPAPDGPQVFCTACGTRLDPGTAFCTACGAKVV